MEGVAGADSGEPGHQSRGRSRKGSRSGRRSRSSSQQARSTLRALLLDADNSDGTPGQDGSGVAGTRVDPHMAGRDANDGRVLAEAKVDAAAALQFPAGHMAMQAAHDPASVGMLPDALGAARMPPPRLSAASFVSFVAATPAGSSLIEGDGDGEGIPATPTEELNLGALAGLRGIAQRLAEAALREPQPVLPDDANAMMGGLAQVGTVAPLTEALLQQQQQEQREQHQHPGGDLLARLLASSSEEEQRLQGGGANRDVHGTDQHVEGNLALNEQPPHAARIVDVPHVGGVRVCSSAGASSPGCKAGQPEPEPRANAMAKGLALGDGAGTSPFVPERLGNGRPATDVAAGADGSAAAGAGQRAPPARCSAVCVPGVRQGGTGSPAVQRRAGAIGRSGATYEPLPLQPSKGSPQPGHLPTAPGSGRGPGSGSASKPGGASIGGAGYGCSKLTSGGGSGTCSDSVHTSRAKLSLASKLLAYSGNPSVSPLGMEFPSCVSSVAVPQLQFAPSTGGRPTCAAGPAVANSAKKSHMVSGAHAGAAAGQAPAAHQLMVTAAPSNVDGAAAHAGMLPGGAALAGATAATAATLSVGWDHRTPACQPVKGLLAAAAAKAAAASGAPSSANSTPFDDEMLAALDSLERRVTAATGQADVDAGAGGSATAHGSDQVANPNPSSVGGGPVQTALELLDKEQGRPAQQQEPAWGGFPRLNQPGRPAWQQQDAYPQARSQNQPQHQPQHVQPGHGGSRHEQQGMQPELMGLPQQTSHGGAPADLGAGASGGGRTPELPIHTAYAQPQPQGGNASAADVTAQKAGSTGPTPEMESGGLFAALDALEERHRLAEVGAAAVVAAAAAAPDGDGQQGQARAASPRLAAAGRADHQQPGAASAGSRRIDSESPLPVKQLAFTPLHVRHAQQQEAQQARPPERPQGYNPYLPPQHPDQGKALANDRPQSEQEQRPAVSGPPQQQLHVSSYGLQGGSGQPSAPNPNQEAGVRPLTGVQPGGQHAQAPGQAGASALGLPPRPPSAQTNRAAPQHLQQQRRQEAFQHAHPPAGYSCGPPPALQQQLQQQPQQQQHFHHHQPQQLPSMAMQQPLQQPFHPPGHVSAPPPQPMQQQQPMLQQQPPHPHATGHQLGQARSLAGGQHGHERQPHEDNAHGQQPSCNPASAAAAPVSTFMAGVSGPGTGLPGPTGHTNVTEPEPGPRPGAVAEAGAGTSSHDVGQSTAQPAAPPAALLAAPPVAPLAPEVDNGSSDDDDDAEAYAAALTQRAVVEGQLRQRRRSIALDGHTPRGAAGGSQVGSGNLAASLAAVASGAGSAAGGTPKARGGEAGAASTPEKRSPGPSPNRTAVDPGLEQEGTAAGAGAGATPSAQPPPAPPRQLEAYLPEPLCQAYYDRSGRQFDLYEWQAECLCQLGVLMGRNLVYCAPTSGGKSMVAEMLGIRRLLTTGKPFMLVLPFVALCAEKADALQALLAPINRTVNSAYGGQTSGKIIQPGVGAIVATIEKANMLVNAMLEEETLGELSAVIVDELHMVGEEERGYLLELLLTKLRFATSAAATANSALTSPGGGGGPNGMTEVEEPPFDWTTVGPAYQRDGLQVIGMSATMPNVDVVARWLDAALYITDFRPVQLQEYVKVGRRIMDGSGALVRELAPDKGWEDKDTDHVALLTQETVREGHSVLIFCASKFWCEKVAEHVARLVAIAQRDPPPIAAAAAGKDPDGGVSPAAARNARDTYVQELRRLSGGDPTLPDLVARGVAYHHAGLSNEERDLIEAAYKAGAISVLTATSTLAAGVNLPARRVIFRHTYIGKQDNPIDATKYRQMSGRAGRAGIDTAGESFIICEKNRPVAPLLALMQQKANPIASCLTEARKGMKRAVLEVVASGAVSSGTDVKRFIACTLIHAQHGFGAVAKATIAALHWLKDNGFIRVDEATLNWGPTPFGKATLASSMPPEEALVVRADLERARMSLVLATDLHVTYLVTPIKEDLRVDWEIYFHWFEKLSKVDARVAELVGVVPGYLVKLRQGHRGARSGAAGAAVTADSEKERIARRFFAAMVLNDLIQEVPLKEVAEKYGLGKEKGPLEGLQERAGRFSAMVAAFCERLGWSDMEVIIAKFQSRVWYGVRPEVVALTEIPYVKGHRARLLFKAGLRTPEAVAACEFDRLLEILSAGGGAKNPEQEEQQRKTERRAARMILQGAKDLVNQKVQELKQQARALRAALDPRASQEHSAPIDPSLAPPRPPAQEGSDARRPGAGGSTSGAERSPGAAGGAAGSKLTARAAHMAANAQAGDPDGAAHSAPDKGGREKDGLENAEARHACAEASAAGPPSDGAAGGARQQPERAQEQSTTPSRPPKQPRTGRSPPERMQVGGLGGMVGTAEPGPLAAVPAPPAAASPGKLPVASALPGTSAATAAGAMGHAVTHSASAVAAVGVPAPVASGMASGPVAAPTAASNAAGAQHAKRYAAGGDACRADGEHDAKRIRVDTGGHGQQQPGRPPWPPDGQQQWQEFAAHQQQNTHQQQGSNQPQQRLHSYQQPQHQHAGQQRAEQPQQHYPYQPQHQQQQQQQQYAQQQHHHHQQYPHQQNAQMLQQAQPQYARQQPQQQQWQTGGGQGSRANVGPPNGTLARPCGPPPPTAQATAAGPWSGAGLRPPPGAPGFQQGHAAGDMRPPSHGPPQQLQGPPLPQGLRPPQPQQLNQQPPLPPPPQQAQYQHQQQYGHATGGSTYPSGPNGAACYQPGAPQQLPQQVNPYLPPGQPQHPQLAAAPAVLQPSHHPPPPPHPQLPSLADKRKLMSPARQGARVTSPGRTGRSPGRWPGRSPGRGGAAASPRGAGRGGPELAQQHSGAGAAVAGAAPVGGGTSAGPSGDESYLHAVQSQVPMLRVPGFTVLKSAGEVAAACEQLRRVGVWAFALDFAEGGTAAAPAGANTNLQLPSVPQVALGRGIATNSVGLPQHFELEPLPVGGCGPAASAGGMPTFALGEAAASVTGRLEGIALCAADGCAVYIPLAATVALPGAEGGSSGGGAGGAPAAVEKAAREAEAVWLEVRQLLAHKQSTKVTFELKSQLLMARAAIQAATATTSRAAIAGSGDRTAPDTWAGAGGSRAGSAAGAFTAALAACDAAGQAAVSPMSEAAAAEAGMGAAAAAAAAAAAGGGGGGALPPLYVADPVVDVRILLWMLNPDDPINMPRGKSGKLSLTKGLEERMKMPEVCGSTAHTKALGVLNCAGVVVRQLPTRQADACRRAAMVRRIYIDKLPRLQSEGLLRPLLELEMPLVRILARMEGEGIALAPQVLKDQRGPLEARLRQLAAKAHLAAGMTFDLNSPKDVSEVLFQHLNLPPPPCAFSNQNQRHPSTKKEVLEELEESTHHPIIRLLLDYRTLHKLLTGFVETLYHTAKGQWQRQQHELERCQGQGQQPQRGGPATGGAVKPGCPGPVPDVIRLCGTWLHTSTATGRLAMDEPNLQTVPRPVEYTFMASQLSQASAGTPPAAGADGAELKLLPGEERGGGAGEGGRSVTLHFNLRSAFVAPPGYMVLAADYKQIELRLMAHFSSDAALCALLRNPAQDPFILLAAEWKKVPVEQVTPEVRVQAKRLAYGMLYGMGTNTLAQELGVSVAEAGELSDNFRRAIPGVDRWMREVVEAVRSCGYTTTLMGRRRYYSRINERASKDARSARAQAERQAVNTVCQGSAADLIKAAMVTLQRRLEAEGLAPHVRMVLMVHDELVFEVAEQLLPAAARLVQAVLEGEVALSVPLPVKLSAGPSWGQLRDYEPPPVPPLPHQQQEQQQQDQQQQQQRSALGAPPPVWR